MAAYAGADGLPLTVGSDLSVQLYNDAVGHVRRAPTATRAASHGALLQYLARGTDPVAMFDEVSRQ